jgi:hypothetical protein
VKPQRNTRCGWSASVSTTLRRRTESLPGNEEFHKQNTHQIFSDAGIKKQFTNHFSVPFH